MSQISPPIRILLVLTVAVLGVYMLFLRPKPVEVTPSEPASTSQPGKIRDAAEDAVDTTNGQLAQEESVDGVDTGEAAAGSATSKQSAQAEGSTAAAPVEDVKGLPKPVRKAIRHDKVLVLLFTNGKSADDRAVESAMKKVDRWDGRVFVHTAPLKRISRYGRVARGVNVEQSPSVVVADRNLRADTLVGYVDRQTIDQSVLDALRNTSGMFTSSYLREVDEVCVHYGNLVHAIPYFYFEVSGKRIDRRVARVSAAYTDFSRDVRAVDAPKKWRGFKSATTSNLGTVTSGMSAFSTAITPKTSVTANLAALKTFNAKTRSAMKSLSKRFDAEGLFRCRSQF